MKRAVSLSLALCLLPLTGCRPGAEPRPSAAQMEQGGDSAAAPVKPPTFGSADLNPAMTPGQKAAVLRRKNSE